VGGGIDVGGIFAWLISAFSLATIVVITVLFLAGEITG
jgi:hypothetical protein